MSGGMLETVENLREASSITREEQMFSRSSRTPGQWLRETKAFSPTRSLRFTLLPQVARSPSPLIS